MIKDGEEHHDYAKKQWAIDSAISMSQKGTQIEKVINSARKIYEFCNPDKCEVVVIQNKKIDGAKNEK